MASTRDLSDKLEALEGTCCQAFTKVCKSAYGLAMYFVAKSQDRASEVRIKETFEEFGLPYPDNTDQFLSGAAGKLVFLNRYGMLLRIELDENHFDRVDDSPFVLPVVKSIRAGKYRVELCLGGKPETDPENVQLVKDLLAADGVDYWDTKVANNGRLPLKTNTFPEGIPIIIDRLAVERHSFSVRGIKRALKSLKRKLKGNPIKAIRSEVSEAIQENYGELIKAFDDAWPSNQKHADPVKMKSAWRLAEDLLEQGKITAGWNEVEKGKGSVAADAAEKYEGRIIQHEAEMKSPAFSKPSSAGQR